MTETKVAYHVEDGVGRPAINVKCYGGHGSFWPDSFDEDDDDRRRVIDAAYERIASDFWQAAQEIATQRGLGEIEQQGRSGGWLVFTSPIVPSIVDEAALGVSPATEADDPEYVAEWLAGYRSMVEWADAWIADAPRKVAALAQQLAMDEAGEEPARRMFAFRPSIGAAMWAYNGGAPKEVMA